MSTSYGWEGIRQVCATLLGARHVSERLCGGACLQRGAITSVRTFLGLYLKRWKRKHPLLSLMMNYERFTFRALPDVSDCVFIVREKVLLFTGLLTQVTGRVVHQSDWNCAELRTYGVSRKLNIQRNQSDHHCVDINWH